MCASLEYKWFHTTQAKPQAVALLIHGLNLRPERMDALAEFLKDCQIDTLRIVLTGHGEDPKAYTKVTRQTWLDDALAGYKLAKDRATALGVPLVFVGYSLGGLVNVDLMNQNPHVVYDKMVLLAPALSVRAYVKPAKALYLLGDEFVAYSLAPKRYRAHSGVAVAAIRALFNALEAFTQSKSPSQQLNIPTLIFINRYDELVSDKGIQDLIANKQFSNWKLILVDEIKPQKGPTYHHLIIDEECLGVESWALMLSTIRQFLA